MVWVLAGAGAEINLVSMVEIDRNGPVGWRSLSGRSCGLGTAGMPDGYTSATPSPEKGDILRTERR
jgi:hypothetical protein